MTIARPLHHVRLLRYLTLAYCGLIIYASLHPFSGWRSRGVSPFSWVVDQWPRYWSFIDVSFDIFSYALLGFLIALDQRERGRPKLAILIGTFFPVLLSFSMESTQTWLPNRVTSNLDWACNSLGGILGVILAFCVGPKLVDRLITWRFYFFDSGSRTDWGITLLTLWLFAQLSPETLPFSTGDLRQFLGLQNSNLYDVPGSAILAKTIVACNLVALGLITRSLLTGHLARSYLAIVIVFSLAMLIRTLAIIILVPETETFGWLTSATVQGLLLGSAILIATLWLPASGRLILAAIALMAGTVLVNLTPESPYVKAALAVWRQGHFLNFNGMTRMVATCWPFLAVSYLLLLGRGENR